MTIDRYRRHELIDWFDQDAVAAARIAVIGAGAIGNEVIKNLALLGAGLVDVYDFDRIEQHNLTRSALFRESDVGRAKAEVASSRASELDPNITVRGIESDFWEAISLATLADDYDVMLACVDNFEARMRASLMCRLAGVNYVSSAIDSRYASVQVHPFAHDSNSACFECDLGPGVYELISQRYSCGWLQKTAFVEKKIPTTAITAAAAGSLVASRALRLCLTSSQDASADAVARSERVLLDTVSGRSTVLQLNRNPECFGCADVAGGVMIDSLTPRALVERFPGADVRLSDAVIVEYACQTDPAHTKESAGSLRWTAAAKQRDTLMHCPQCNDLSIRIDMAEELTLPDQYDDDFAPGCKFVRIAHPDASEQVIEIASDLNSNER